MTVEDLNTALTPVIEAQAAQSDLLGTIIEALHYNAQVTAGVILALGFVAGLLVMWLFLDRFK